VHLPGWGETRRSTSAEYPGYPCQETASAPTTGYSTLFEFKHSTNSRKSLLKGIGVGWVARFEENVDPFLRAHSGPGEVSPSGSDHEVRHE
jgi:hypothetical protein